MAFYSIYFEFIINKIYHISNASGMHMKADKNIILKALGVQQTIFLHIALFICTFKIVYDTI